MLPATAARVAQQTNPEVNSRIRRRTAESVRWHAHNRGAIPRRLAELDHEWDIERVLEANASTAVLLGLAAGATVDRRFFVVPGLVAAFLLQHALQGWCPPLPIFRRLGFRTQTEIEAERYALKAVRGDFETAAAGGKARALSAVRS
ncbi:MAG: hypothetical protein ABI629_06165 [bacterium]